MHRGHPVNAPIRRGFITLLLPEKCASWGGFDDLMYTQAPSKPSLLARVKSDDFGQRVNSDIHLQTVKIQMRRLLIS